MEALDFYPQKRMIVIDWDEGDLYDKEDREEKNLERGKDDLSYTISPEIELIHRVKVLKTGSAILEDLEISPAIFLSEYHIMNKFATVFDTNQTFLIIELGTRGFSFLCSNLIFQLNDSRKNAQFLDVENDIGDF